MLFSPCSCSHLMVPEIVINWAKLSFYSVWEITILSLTMCDKIQCKFSSLFFTSRSFMTRFLIFPTVTWALLIIINSFLSKCQYHRLTFVTLIFVFYWVFIIIFNFIIFYYCSIRKTVDVTFTMVFMRQSYSWSSLGLHFMISIFISIFRAAFITIEKVIFIGFIFWLIKERFVLVIVIVIFRLLGLKIGHFLTT